jgi:hypothetical protein
MHTSYFAGTTLRNGADRVRGKKEYTHPLLHKGYGCFRRMFINRKFSSYLLDAFMKVINKH